MINHALVDFTINSEGSDKASAISISSVKSLFKALTNSTSSLSTFGALYYHTYPSYETEELEISPPVLSREQSFLFEPESDDDRTQYSDESYCLSSPDSILCKGLERHLKLTSFLDYRFPQLQSGETKWGLSAFQFLEGGGYISLVVSPQSPRIFSLDVSSTSYFGADLIYSSVFELSPLYLVTKASFFNRL